MKDYVLGLYEKAVPAELSWEERLRVAGECGFDYMELSIDEKDRLSRLDWGRSEIRELEDAMDAVGAIVGKVSVTEEVELVPEDGEDGEQVFTVTNRTETRQFSDYEEAAAFAQESALKQAEAAAREQGASGGLSITEERERVEGTLRYGSFWIKELYRATATGNVRI